MDVDNASGFGRAFGEKHFMFKPGFVHLNQGSYGAYPRPVRDALRSVQDQVQAEPDVFVRNKYPKLLEQVRGSIASFIHADVDEVVVVPNATIGLNTILRNLQFRSGDLIAYVQGTYGAIEKTVHYLVETTLVQSICIPFDPIADGDDKLLQAFRTVLQENQGRVRVAIFDTVMSMPGLKMPFERLTRVCEEFQALSVIDGAHGIGLIDLDLTKLNADFLVTNCHKWLFVPHTCAVLYVAQRNQHLMRSSLPTSHGFQPLSEVLKGKKYISPYEAPAASTNLFVFQFGYTGTVDNGPPLCVPTALSFRKHTCGGEIAIQEYCRTLAKDGEMCAAEILETRALSVPESKRVAFANVCLPLEFSTSTTDNTSHCIPLADLQEVVDFLMNGLARDYNTFVNIAFVSGSLWARFSAMVYLEIDDFEHGARALKELCKQVIDKQYVLK
ncbi:Fc.00g115590.m01.CDS01 [Cosmosporella sp. VM-42]